ncbi:MAG: dihydrofolate reductase family protein [Cyanobacteria bacterium]|nr:dihydrofolate reductase family protein [Cyanobacteriota bacterium]MDA1246571.1 dihydrofolate reductase family protein [Cyanobacteriota bacterium]
MLRLVLAVSLDGRLAPPQGGAAQLGGVGDRQVLEEALAWADGCLIGAETLRRHGSTCLIRAPHLLAQRAASGRGHQPVAVVVSRSNDISQDLHFWQQPLQRWLLTPKRSPLAQAFDRRLDLDSWSVALAGLADQGLERLVVLGGAALAASLLAEGWIDELQLTICPQLLGGPHAWVPLEAAVHSGEWCLQEHRQLAGEELLLRYRRILINGAGG